MPDLHDLIPTREKVLIIGAGPAGLAAAAALKALEVPFDLVDQAAHVGGIWDPEREDSPVWPTMEMISSRELTQYEDMLQPVSFPEYLSPTQMAKYLRAYAARHDLTEHFRPRTAVRSARPFDEGVWEVEFSTGEVGIYRAVVSAHGISEHPHRPAWAADVPSSVRVVHAKDWTGADGLEGQRVLVVGSGQSAADISVDAARRALELRWCMRTGRWAVPRRIGGVPGDVAASREPSVLGGLNARIAEAVIRRAAAHAADAGLPAAAAPPLRRRAPELRPGPDRAGHRLRVPGRPLPRGPDPPHRLRRTGPVPRRLRPRPRRPGGPRSAAGLRRDPADPRRAGGHRRLHAGR